MRKASAEIKNRGLSETARANAVLRVGPWLSKPGDEYSRFPSSKPELIFTYRDALEEMHKRIDIAVVHGKIIVD